MESQVLLLQTKLPLPGKVELTQWAGLRTHFCRRIPMKSCRPIRAKTLRQKTVRIITSASFLTDWMRALTMVFKPEEKQIKKVIWRIQCLMKVAYSGTERDPHLGSLISFLEHAELWTSVMLRRFRGPQTLSHTWEGKNTSHSPKKAQLFEIVQKFVHWFLFMQSHDHFDSRLRNVIYTHS